MRKRPLLALCLAGCYGRPDLPPWEPVPVVGVGQCAQARTARVACVLDGDTFDVGACGQDSGGERIRMLGIDAPEIAHPPDPTPADCYGDEAADELSRVLDRANITLSFDEECKGVYGRTLGYVWMTVDEASDVLSDEDIQDLQSQNFANGSDGNEELILINEYLLLRGYVALYDEDWVGDLLLQQRLDDAQATAEARGAGLWGHCPQ